MNVTVKSKQGNWLMPTYPAKARFLLKQGKATVIQRTPFAIQLNEETTEHTQDIVVGIDDGGIHVGIACVANDEAIYQEEVQLRTDIKRKMDTRRSYRRGRRHRHCRYRQPRFLNRKNSHKTGRIPPSIKAKKDTIVRTIHKLPLPTPVLIRLEDAYFDFQAMDDPTITGKGYQQGAMLSQKNYKSAAKTRDGFISKSHCNDTIVIAQQQVTPKPHFIKSNCIQLRKRSLHEATARKGRKQPNTTQKRNNKNIFQVKTFKKWDCIRVFGKIGFISGFTGTSAYIVDIDGNYTQPPKKSYKQMTLSKMKKLHSNQDRISQYCLV